MASWVNAAKKQKKNHHLTHDQIHSHYAVLTIFHPNKQPSVQHGPQKLDMCLLLAA